MIKKTLISTAALGALVAASAISPASAQHQNWDWQNNQNDVRNPLGVQRGPAYGYGYGYAPAPAYYGPSVSFGVGFGPSYGYAPRHYGPRYYGW